MNCSGLWALRSIIRTHCNHYMCNHPPNSTAVFEWMFPLVKKELDLAIPLVAATFTNLLFNAMEYSNTAPLEKLLSIVPDVNSIEILKRFSPAHFIASRLGLPEYWNCSQFLLNKGLNLHVVADERFSMNLEYKVSTFSAKSFKQIRGCWRQVTLTSGLTGYFWPNSNTLSIALFFNVFQLQEVAQELQDRYQGVRGKGNREQSP